MTSIGELFARLTLDDSQFQAGMKAASASMQAATVSAGALSSALTAVGATAAAVGAAMSAGFGAAVVSGVETAASMQQIQLGFEALMGGAQAATDEIAKLNAMAAQTPFEFKDLVKGEQQLLAAGKSLNLTADGARALLAAVGDRIGLMGGSADQIRLVDIALSQMMMKGKVSAQEMNQMAESGFDPWQRLAAELGVSTAAAQDMVTKGLVPAAKMMQAIVNQPGAALGAMQKQSQTLIGLFSTLKDVVAQGLGKAAQPLVESLTAAMPAITDFAATLIAAMDPLIRGLGAVAQQAVDVLAAFNALDPSIQQFGIYAAVVGTAVVAGVAAIGVALLSLVPTIAAVATAFASLDVAAAPFLILAAAIGASAVLAFGPWVAWFGVLTAGAAALYAAWENDFLGIASVIKGLAGILYDLASNALGAVYQAFRAIDPAIGGVIDGVAELAANVTAAGGEIYSALSHAFSLGGVLGALTAIKTAMIDTAMSVLSSINQMISGALPLLTRLGAGGSATATQGAILGSMLQLGSMSGAVALPPEVEESINAATAATTDYRGALDGLLDVLDGAGKKGKSAASSAREHAKAMKDEQKAAKDAADALRDYIKLYEDAADAVYAKKSNPAADFQKDFEAGIADFMPQFELSVGDKLDAAEADLAIALSRNVITEELYNQDLAEIVVARQKAEADIIAEAIKAGMAAAEKQKEAARATAKGIADEGMNIVSSMGKFGELVDSAKEGAQIGGWIGALVAVIGKLLSWNGKFQESIKELDDVIMSVTGALDGLVEGLNPLSRAVGRIIAVVVNSLSPIFDFVGDILIMLSPILQRVASLLTALAGAFQIVSGILTMISPILYAAFDVIDTVLRGVAIVILGVMYGIETVWNAIIDVVADVLKAVGANDAAKKLKANKADAQGTLDQINKLIETSYEDAIKGKVQGYEYSGEGFYAGTEALGDSATQAAGALDTLTQSLSNVPTGFKLEQYIYDAADGLNRGPTSANPGGGTVVYINEVHIAEAADIASLTAEVVARTRKKTVYGRYTSNMLPSRWGTS